MTARRGALLLLIMTGLAACTPERPPIALTSIDRDEVGGYKTGQQLYYRDCAWCHGDRGQGTDIAPDLVGGTNGPALTHFMLTTGRMPLDYPEQRMTRRPAVYEPEEVQEIVDFVATLQRDGPDIPEVDPAAGDLALGLELYQANCAACHSTTGIGGALAPSEAEELREEQVERPSTIAPDLGPSTPVEIAEAMLTGPGTMPVFARETFSEHEMNSIVRYTQYLQDPNNAGGLPVGGGIGPVAEGFYGWVGGLGLLLLLSRWLGTKAGE